MKYAHFPSLQSAGDQAIRRVAAGIFDSSEHKALQEVFIVNPMTLKVGAQVQCEDCESRWRWYLDLAEVFEWERSHPQGFRRPGEYVEYLIREMAGTMSKALDQPCWAAMTMGPAAEWVTESLIEAGPAGMPVRPLVEQAVYRRICPAERLLFLLSYMGLMPKGPEVPAVIRLPQGHPLRTWAEDRPHPHDGTVQADVLRAIGPWFPV